MKFLIAAIMLTISVAHASNVNLSLGESVTIQANSSPTTVTCGSENQRCKLAVKSLKTKLDYCKVDIDTSEEECLNQIWPRYKADNNQCINEGFDTCFNFCKEIFPRLNCVLVCN